MRRLLRAAAATLLLFLVACSVNEPATTVQNPEAVDPVQTALDMNAPLKEFQITAKQFEFSPSTISVSKGDVVKLILYSEDVDHGITIPEFSIELGVPAREKKTITFVADQQGEFPFYCNIYCGVGHGSMRGLLIVQ